MGEQMNHSVTFYANDVEVAQGTLVGRNDKMFTFKNATLDQSKHGTARLTVAVHRHNSTPLVLDDCHVMESDAGKLVLFADQIIGDDSEAAWV
jgi:hypothetical protein